MAGNPVLTEHDWETLDRYNPCKHDAAKGRFLKVLEFVREHMKEGWDSSISGEEVWAEVIKFDPHDMKIGRHLDCIFRKGFIDQQDGPVWYTARTMATSQARTMVRTTPTTVHLLTTMRGPILV